MQIRQYTRVLGAHWVLIVATVLLCTAAAAIYAWTREPVYAAETQLFVSAKTEASVQTPSGIYEGGLASQSRAQSYARIVSSPPVAEAIIDTLGLSVSPESLEGAITATVPPDTVLIDVRVEAKSAQRAKDIADAVAVDFPEFVDQLESTTDPEESPVELQVTSPAVLPESPESPNKGLYLLTGALLGLVLGVGAAILRELVSGRVRDDEAATAIAGAPVLGHIPRDALAGERPLVVVDDPDSPEAEAYRRLRTNVQAATIDRGQNSVLITSAVSGDGKTLIAANLGFAFAQAGHRVALVDADLRRSSLSRLLGLDPGPGLSEALAGDALADVIHGELGPSMEVLTSGAAVPNPGGLLASDAFATVLDRLTNWAGLVIVDSPALLPVSDAAVMARVTAAVLMVARVSSTRAEDLEAAAESLRTVGAPPVGAVLNGFSARQNRSYIYGSDGRAAEEVSEDAESPEAAAAGRS
jgi:capsular exopolysaccharide synthesis family protein